MKEKIDPCESCEAKGLSSCCGAEIIMGDICSDCQEHCDDACSDCDFKNE